MLQTLSAPASMRSRIFFHPLRREVALQPDLLGALDGRVRHVAGGMVLEEVVAQVPARRRLAQRLLDIEMIALRGGEALVAFQ
jgi:hypothetical protein